jgi:hypothetical protein
MNGFLKWLLGIRQSPDWIAGGRWHLEFASLPQGLWGLATILGLILAVLGIRWLYRREGRNLSVWHKLLLGTLRFAELVGVLLILLEMVLVITKHQLTPSQLVVLVDKSESMSLSDPYSQDEEAKQVANRLHLRDEIGRADVATLRKTSRLDLAKQLLPELVDELAAGREVIVQGFGAKLEPADADHDWRQIQPTGEGTAIGDAIKNALAARRGQPIAGVLLVTDGQSNAGADPRSIAAAAGKDHIPIVSLAVGTDAGPANVRITEIEASPVVFVRDPTELNVVIEAVGMEGRTGILSLEVRKEGGDWTEIAHEDVLMGADAKVRHVTFPFTPEASGQYEFRARISDVGAELTEADNVALHTMKVVRQRIRTLLVAGHPSPEVQFIRNTLLRDQTVEFASWLQNADDNYEHIGHKPIRRLPNDQAELDHYDVLILFDPDLRQLGSAWSEMIAKFVGEAGGGLIYVAAEMNTNRLFASGLDNAAGQDNGWVKVLPVVSDPALYESSVDLRTSAAETFNIELTQEGAGDQIFRFVPDLNKNRDVLGSLPGMYWHFPITRAKQGATVLARHGDPRMANQFGRHVLLATHLYGPGRTVFVGFDSTYRWRYLHEDYFDGFWTRMIDRVGRNKVLGGRYPFLISTDKNIYRTGERVGVRVKAIQRGEEQASLPELRSEIEIGGQGSAPLTLEPATDGSGSLESSFTASEPGTYTVRITPVGAADSDGNLRPATLQFHVEPPLAEMDNPKLNRAVLEELAHLSDGKVFDLDQYESVPSAFKIKQVDRVLEFRNELWDAPILFGGVIALLAAEWILRKKNRMA